MKILMVLASYFPPDSRVEKEAVSLTENGHEVHLLCYSKPNQQETENFEGINVHRINCSDFFVNKLSALALLIPCYFRKWQTEIGKLVLKYDIEAIHVHDLPLSKAGYYFKKKYNCKLILDQHEFYSDWIKKTAHMNTAAGKMVSRFSNWENFERHYLTRADLVVTVAEPLRTNYMSKYMLNQNKIITVPNTPSSKIYNQNNVKPELVNRYKNDFILFYAGGIDILRGIDTAVIALKKIRTKIPNVKLLLAGRIARHYDPFKTAKEHGVEDLVKFEGWIDENELPSYIAASNICFFTPPANRDEINKTIATKIYQYAIMNKPIIVSEAKMMKEFVEENNLGISIHSQNAEEFYNAVVKIYNNEAPLKKMVNDKWMWETTVKDLISGYKKLNANDV